MILLTATTDKLQIISSAVCDLDIHCSYADYSSSFAISGLGRQNTNITTATTTDILDAPAASTTRNLKQLTCRNTTTTNCDVTVQFNQNATLFELYKVTLGLGDMLEFVEGVGFFTVSAITATRLVTNLESNHHQRVFRSLLPTVAQTTFLMITNTGYAVYMGRATQAVTVGFVEFEVSSAGAGTQTAEVGVFSTPAAPSKSALTLTKIVATGTVDSLTGTGMKRNTSSCATTIPGGTHVWAVIRTAMATTQPTMRAGYFADKSQGHILTTATPGALTSLTTMTGFLIALNTAAVCPELYLTLD